MYSKSAHQFYFLDDKHYSARAEFKFETGRSPFHLTQYKTISLLKKPAFLNSVGKLVEKTDFSCFDRTTGQI